MTMSHALSRKLAVAAVVVAAVPGVLAGCGSIPSKAERAAIAEGSRLERDLTAYHVVNSVNTGRVGFVKTYNVTETGGATYQWRYVYDLNLNEVGFVDQFGTAHHLRPYSPFESGYQKYSVRDIVLPTDSIEANVMRMLGMNPATDSVAFAVATNADIAGK